MYRSAAMLLKSWLRRLWHWVAEIPTFWAFVTVLGAVVVDSIVATKDAEDALRYAGLILQLLGVGVVAHTLRGRGKLFGREPVLTFAKSWLRRVPRLCPKHIVLEASASAQATSSATLDASVWRGPRQDQPVEAQLEAMRENISTLRLQVERLENRSSQKMAELYNAIELERTQRSSQVQEAKRTMETLATESLYLEVAGLAWLVTGIVLATIPQELAKLVARVMQ